MIACALRETAGRGGRGYPPRLSVEVATSG